MHHPSCSCVTANVAFGVLLILAEATVVAENRSHRATNSSRMSAAHPGHADDRGGILRLPTDHHTLALIQVVNRDALVLGFALKSFANQTKTPATFEDAASRP